MKPVLLVLIVLMPPAASAEEINLVCRAPSFNEFIKIDFDNKIAYKSFSNSFCSFSDMFEDGYVGPIKITKNTCGDIIMPDVKMLKEFITVNDAEISFGASNWHYETIDRITGILTYNNDPTPLECSAVSTQRKF